MPEPVHSVRVEPDLNVTGMSTAVCSCGWMGGDEGTADTAATDARMHERGEYHPWQVPPGDDRAWSPERRPFHGT